MMKERALCALTMEKVYYCMTEKNVIGIFGGVLVRTPDHRLTFQSQTRFGVAP